MVVGACKAMSGIVEGCLYGRIGKREALVEER